MEEKEIEKEIGKHALSGAFYVMGFIGALVYYIANATGFWMGVLGIWKAMVWPVILVYELFKHLGM